MIDGIHYYIDDQLVERYAEALSKQNAEDMESVMKDTAERLSGVCFCSAHSSSECICGAWD